MEWLLAGLGLVILLVAGDFLVKGAVNLSLRLGIPALVVSLTIVAFGTSAPELLISVNSVLEGVPGIALGNVIGSNIANVLLVLGLPALLMPLSSTVSSCRRSYFQMLIASVIFIAVAFTGVFSWWAGISFLSILSYMLWDATRGTRCNMTSPDIDEPDELEGADPDMPWWKIWMFLALGLLGLPLGADILVENATEIAREFGVSEAIIGLTLVALGTSLPELATAIVAALHKQADVALGNVIGSNMFNLLGIIGVASLVGPIPVDAIFLEFDLWIMLGVSLVLAPFAILRWPLTRPAGFLLSGLYALYIAVVVY